MKKIILTTVFGFLLQLNVIPQTKKYKFDVNMVDYQLFNKLFFEKVNKVRDSLKIEKINLDMMYGNMSKYQSNYMANFDTLTHINEKKFQGVRLKNLKDRLDYFYKNQNIQFSMEICVKISVKKNNLLTYEDIIEKIVFSYLNSPGHRMALLDSSKYYKVYINSSFRLNYDKNNLYHSAFISEY